MAGTDEDRERQGSDVITDTMRQLVLRAVDRGVGPVTASRPWAEQRRERAGGQVEAAITAMVNESVALAGSAGFVTGVGGLLTLPVALPANLAGSLAVNARLAGGIAHLRGHDLSDQHTRDLLVVVVVGGGPQRLLGELGKRSGVKLAATVLRAVPVVGGLANGAADAGLTVATARNLRRAFPSRG